MLLQKIKEPNDRTIKRIKKTLMADIYWAVKYGPGFEAESGAKLDGKTWGPHDKWISQNEKKTCGVCAIGALCLRRKPKVCTGRGLNGDWGEPFKDAISAAKVLKTGAQWTQVLYLEVAAPNRSQFYIAPKATALGTQLRSYGEALMEMQTELRAEAEVEAHDEAQAIQEAAEAQGLTR